MLLISTPLLGKIFGVSIKILNTGKTNAGFTALLIG